MRTRVLPILFCLACFLMLISTVAAEEDILLMRVDRINADDLKVLLNAGVPVVMEMNDYLFIEGNRKHLEWLNAHGYAAAVLHEDPGSSDYLVIGLRPDSDLDAIYTLGEVLDSDENWIMIRVDRETTYEPLYTARVFVTRMPHEAMLLPREADPRWAKKQPSASGDQSATFGPADPIVQKIVNQVSTADIDAYWQDLTTNPPTGTRYSSSQGCRDAAAYCKTEYESLKLPAAYQEYSGSYAPNVVGTQEGALSPDKIYIVEGHLDDLPSSGLAPGADDNASGSVTVLEAAKVMSCWAFKSTVKYLVVTGEEQGLNGSEYYADYAYSHGENILGVLNFDMNGWAGDGNPTPENLDVDFNSASQWLGELFAECSQKYGTGLVVDAFLCNISASDHYPFWQKGYHAILGITDNEGYCGHAGNYPYYHQSSDTIANCGNPSFFYSTVRTTVATLAEMAEPFKITMTKPAYGCGSGIGIVVGDRDLNTNPGQQETVTVEVWSDTETTHETMILTERGSDSMIFEGVILTTEAPPAHGDNLLSVEASDTITAEYVDMLDCDGATNVTYTSTALIDCVQPLISNVGEQNISDTSATVTWDTDEDSSSTVHWGMSRPPANTTGKAEMTVDHEVPLTGLQQCTVYYYSVESEDIAGNSATDNSGGQYYHFETYGNFGSGLQPCHGGRATLDKDAYTCSSSVALQVIDMDLNKNPLVAETATLYVTSTTESVLETVTVMETGPNTSRFTGSIQLAQGTPVPDGLLQASDGDIVTVTYLDADDGTGASAVSFDTAMLDCSGPAIQNLRITEITDQRFTVQFGTSEPGNTVVQWGLTPGLGNTITQAPLVTNHQVQINTLDICQDVYIRVSSTDANGNTVVGDMNGTPHQIRTWDIPGLYFRDTFENGPSNWTLGGEWQIDMPRGLGGSSGYQDPSSAYNNARIMGNDLTGMGAQQGDYEHSITEDATTQTLDASAWNNTKLILYRQLNVMRDDLAKIAVIKRHKENDIYSSNNQIVSQSGYSQVSYDVSSLMDGQNSVKLRFKIIADPYNMFGDDGISSGWNIDDVILKDGSLPDYDACGGCLTPPSFYGVKSVHDNDACGAMGVTVTWDAAVSWGTGGSGTYTVYRDIIPDFAPTAANRIVAGIAGTSYNDAAAPVDRTLYYLVRAENNETCSSGPNNGGMTDSNTAHLSVDETTSQPVPGEVTALRAEMVNHAHLRLSWQAPAGAALYRIYRSTEPDTGFVLLEETGSLYYDDLNQGGNANSYFYKVTAVNGCDQEGP